MPENVPFEDQCFRAYIDTQFESREIQIKLGQLALRKYRLLQLIEALEKLAR